MSGRRDRSGRGARRGFTLVEVMVSLGIFALLAAAGGLVLSQTIDTRFAVRAETDRTGDLQRMRALLKADLAQAAPRRTRAPTGRPLPRALMGQQTPGDPILVLARNGWSNPEGAPRPSLQRVEYRVVEGRLERRVSPYLDGARSGPPQILYRGVADVAVTFIQDGAEAPAFIASSDRPLPDAVRIVMTLEGIGPVDQLFLVASA
ncbi:type II secretion system minor pseudopilin GspJ [Brevundimonas sp.]|jgi:general secretion pathway protein J|uniref:type II secretion system minor pseudopilin GspJ n=1 Tax=Brevundimonas sp. TaxID=1871086 RepID=UPI0037BE66E1